MVARPLRGFMSFKRTAKINKNNHKHLVFSLVYLMLVKSFMGTFVLHHEHDLDQPHHKQEHAHIIVSGFSFYQHSASLNTQAHDVNNGEQDHGDEDHSHPFLHFICPHCGHSFKSSSDLPILSQGKQDEPIYRNPLADGVPSSLLRPPIHFQIA